MSHLTRIIAGAGLGAVLLTVLSTLCVTFSELPSVHSTAAATVCPSMYYWDVATGSCSPANDMRQHSA